MWFKTLIDIDRCVLEVESVRYIYHNKQKRGLNQAVIYRDILAPNIAPPRPSVACLNKITIFPK